MAEEPIRDLVACVCPLSMAGTEMRFCRVDCVCFKATHDRRDICTLFDSINQISMNVRAMSKYTQGGQRR